MPEKALGRRVNQEDAMTTMRRHCWDDEEALASISTTAP